ncbi:hypothetical protein KAFR_0B01550 [Kazachstania africana CBS 2517]|uniref:Phosphatase PP2A regulatory subunit A/Splicing factor 3B subunit 1-like HEAT repeat domain-containing protein n=1 Tax=Kazachstania africana (strain ATCC 22294 / BCRC 22015 / CBS 2517 / CECT 1963 / NBRC 1671 / NRRL Y-8276) TaxID=1071382 RepID=H2AQ04_KAZAF|nr:hypothetical protein KAFR_0B01550 [Kazachstania africana CBS 2517]CCF56454.1 hypothetical protein KAFR_0B01550 [Kazachstania africana CBS 2517]
MTEASGTQKHQIGGTYGIPQYLREEMQNKERDEQHTDILQERIKNKSAYNKEDEYHKRRLDSNASEPTKEEGRLVVVNDKYDEHEIDHVSKKRKSRWDVQSYVIPEESKALKDEIDQSLVLDVPEAHSLRFFKASDKLHFAALINKKPFESLSDDEKRERHLLSLILRIKNGTSSIRKQATRQLTDKCQNFGPKLIFDSILPILLDKELEDQERHLLIKIIDRVLYKLDALVKPYTRDILVVVSPLLIDEDPILRTVGKEIINNLSSVVGLSTMLTAMRTDIDNDDEYIRNISSRTLAIIGQSLGVSKLLPFINAACHSRKSWKARHTSVKIVLQLSVLLGSGVLPYLNGLIQCIFDGLTDEHIPIRILTANTLASLAQNSYPYGLEAFDFALKPLWKGLHTHRGKVLAAFLKCLGSIIPLMDSEYASYYTDEIMKVIQRHFNSPDDEMRKAVLVVLQKCSQTDSITSQYLRKEVVPSFFQNFWTRRVSLDLQLNKIVVYTTVVLSEKIGCAYVIENLLKPLRDEVEPFRTMAVHAVNRVVKRLGTADLDERLETRLLDALLVAFQGQTSDDSIIFRGFGTVATSLDKRMKPFLSPIISTILFNLKHKDQMVRQHAADLCNIMVPVIKNCGEVEMLNKLSIILYESLGEVYPEVLGSIILVIGTIVRVMDLDKLEPPVNQILPSLTPILRNRHNKVQFNIINVVGFIARKGPSYAPPKEWMRICFQLLEMLKSTNKKIRKSANATFGYIAKALGPQDVLVVLLNNLKVQERQLRVCTAVAIGIVAKTCGPYTVLPALMNEYKTPETNVQNGVLKAMTFIFEYIGDLAQDYIYLTVPLLEDALIDRDLVHRQTAATVIKHIALHCANSGNEDAFIHLLNLLVPNIFETSPHVIARILDGLEALSHTLGPGIFMNYIWAGLFHPAKNVRKAFWRVYNTAYVQHMDSLVPYYPITNDESTRIAELDIII